ncbi:Ankyrin-repeat containing protein-1 [Operophtera brumata]|uniref:Ankyrin-repeat containing protein-1 n=1 Tax=Operophtera brumata TaxID=104452 RepID=A0A0L7KVV1_OPEBR|nr:Ankyrin-repeat containing protein-1 [Operophtera brumata]
MRFTRVMTAGTARCIYPPSMGNTLCQLADTSRLLLVRGCDANACDDCGYSALHLSAEHGGAALDYRPDSGEEFPRTTLCDEPLRLAIRNKHYSLASLELVTHLLQSSAALDYRPDSGEEFPRTTLCDEPLRLAIRNKHYSLASLELVTRLLQSGAALDYRPDSGEEFPRTTLCDEPLRLAIRNKHYSLASLELVLDYRPDSGEEFPRTTLCDEPLRLAIRNKHYINLVSDPEYLELLLTFGANPDSRDRAGLTPLMKAARQRRGIEAVLLLIHYGADVNAMADARNDYRTVMHYAVLSGEASFTVHNNSLCIETVVPGAQLNTSSSVIGSPLQVACSDNITNRKEMIKVIMKTQFRDPDGINHLRTSRLSKAAESFDLCMIKRNNVLNATQKQTLIERAKTPISLIAQTRIYMRRYLGPTLVKDVPAFDIPKILHQYLTFECR